MSVFSPQEFGVYTKKQIYAEKIKSRQIYKENMTVV